MVHGLPKDGLGYVSASVGGSVCCWVNVGQLVGQSACPLVCGVMGHGSVIQTTTHQPTHLLDLESTYLYEQYLKTKMMVYMYANIF